MLSLFALGTQFHVDRVSSPGPGETGSQARGGSFYSNERLPQCAVEVSP